MCRLGLFLAAVLDQEWRVTAGVVQVAMETTCIRQRYVCGRTLSIIVPCLLEAGTGRQRLFTVELPFLPANGDGVAEGIGQFLSLLVVRSALKGQNGA